MDTRILTKGVGGGGLGIIEVKDHNNKYSSSSSIKVSLSTICCLYFIHLFYCFFFSFIYLIFCVGNSKVLFPKFEALKSSFQQVH